MDIRKIGKTVTKRTAAQTSKTKRHTRVDPLVKSYIGEAARHDQKATGKQLRERVFQRLHSEGLKMDIPGVRKTQDIAKEARGKKGIQLDDVWSLAVRIPWIPPDATGDLLAVWKHCLTHGLKFTIREAVWVSRLRSALPAAGPSHIYDWAVAYARLERSNEVHEDEYLLSSTPLDAVLAFQRYKSVLHEWDYDQAIRTGLVPLNEGLINPRFINEIPDAQNIIRLPDHMALGSEYFSSVIGNVLYDGKLLSPNEYELLRKDKLSWWPQARSVMMSWLRRIATDVKKWQGIDMGYGGNLPGEKEHKEFTLMAAKLVSMVIQRGQRIDAMQKYLASEGSYDDMWAHLKARKLPVFYKGLGFQGDWSDRELFKEVISNKHLWKSTSEVLKKLRLDEQGNPLRANESLDKEASCEVT